jgi:sulfide:quinone oxidoreductase
MGKLAATNVAEMIKHGASAEVRTVSIGAHGRRMCRLGQVGTTARERRLDDHVPGGTRPREYPGTGRSLDDTLGDRPGRHWIKLLLHYLFIYKAKARPGWHLIPE